MTTITVPKELQNKELIAVPRKSYEEFLVWQKNLKAKKTFKPTPTEKRALAAARKNFTRGNYTSLSKLHNDLAGSRR